MNNIVETQVVPSNALPVRIDNYILNEFDIFPSRKSVKKAIKRGEIRVNGEIPEPFVIIQPGQLIDITESKETPAKTYDLDLRILYEDDWLAVVEKPPGLIINGNRFKTLENALPYSIEASKQKDALIKPRPVHRLDACTGGLVIAAKTSKAHVDLSHQFQHREINKRYRAIVIGKLDNDGVISYSIDGKEANTVYSSVEYIPSLKTGWLTLVDLWPMTGRYHQIRRHLSIMGFPVLGDKLYGTEGNILKSKGVFLWAVEISLKHPFYKWTLTITIKEAPKFETFINREKRRWIKYHRNMPSLDKESVE